MSPRTSSMILQTVAYDMHDQIITAAVTITLQFAILLWAPA